MFCRQFVTGLSEEIPMRTIIQFISFNQYQPKNCLYNTKRLPCKWVAPSRNYIPQNLQEKSSYLPMQPLYLCTKRKPKIRHKLLVSVKNARILRTDLSSLNWVGRISSCYLQVVASIFLPQLLLELILLE